LENRTDNFPQERRFVAQSTLILVWSVRLTAFVSTATVLPASVWRCADTYWFLSCLICS